MDWAKTTAWGHKKHLSFGIWSDLYKRFYGMWCVVLTHWGLNSMVALFSDGIFKCTFVNSIKIYWNENMLALVQIMAWHRPDDKPFSEPIMVILLTHICDKPLLEPVMTKNQEAICVTKSKWMKPSGPICLQGHTRVPSDVLALNGANFSEGCVDISRHSDVYKLHRSTLVINDFEYVFFGQIPFWT